MRVAHAAALLLVLTGCSSISPVQLGQTVGSIAGSAVAPGVGMPLGALVGSLAGMVFESRMDKAREHREHAELSERLGTPPAARSAAASAVQPTAAGTPTRVWVDERYEQGKLIAGRFEWQPVP